MKVSQTQIKAYKSCRRLYELSYIENLRYNKDIEALETGKSYHSKIEQLYKTGVFECTGDKTDAMAYAYQKYICPKFKATVAEEWFEFALNEKHTLVGKVDAIAEDGLLVEHKTTSGDIGEEYVYNLQWNEQVPAYMLSHGVTEMYYTAIRKPTIRQKMKETNEEFIQRCREWYDEDTENKIRVFKVTRTPEELEEYRVQLLNTIDEMENCKLFYKNTAHCTCWGRRCEFAPICLNYDPKLEYIDFTKIDREKQKKELSENELF